MNIPQSLVAGDTWSWTEILVDYKAPTWTVVYHLKGPQSIALSASDSGSDHAFSIPASTTADYKPGDYEWLARVNDGTTYTTLAEGKLTVKPDLATAKYEHRSFWRQVLDQLEPVILGKASMDQLSMSIAGRSLTRMTWKELLEVYDRAKQAVASENGDMPSRVYVRY